MSSYVWKVSIISEISPPLSDTAWSYSSLLCRKKYVHYVHFKSVYMSVPLIDKLISIYFLVTFFHESRKK